MKKPLLLLALILALVAGFLWLGGNAETHNTPSQEVVSDTGEVLIGGAFTLTDHTGKIVQDTDFRGKAMLVFFGFTHCPDICPVTIAILSKTLDALGPDADKVATLFITVDPQRDTPEVLKDYLANFNPRITGLTGTPDQIKTVIDAYKAYAARSESVNAGAVPQDGESHDAHEEHGHYGDQDDNYAVDHSGFIYIMGKDGKYINHLPFNVGEKELSHELKEYLNK